MFGTARDTNDPDTLDSNGFDEFFGDEEAAADNSVEIHVMRNRIDQVDSQINSQFTSLATYAQIAQEQSSSPCPKPRQPEQRPRPQRLTSRTRR